MEDMPSSDAGVQHTHYLIQLLQSNSLVHRGCDQGSLRELLTGGRSQPLRRTVITVVCQLMQQPTAIMDEPRHMARLSGAAVAGMGRLAICLSAMRNISWPRSLQMLLIDHVGCRILMLIGTMGQCILMPVVLLAILGSINNGTAQSVIL
ncbi:hypothetical protein BU15DRAFT_63636 [Melanogaster broomeanus]|nr:hypothetical protein BU15DRAFT_63636 [Melanogaster broomeanus]